jgi:ABC-type branched-subunit amino acid transport system permease subunit
MSGALSGPSVRVPAMVTGGIIGGLGGLMWAMQSSSGRLMGFLPNDAETKRAR